VLLVRLRCRGHPLSVALRASGWLMAQALLRPLARWRTCRWVLIKQCNMCGVLDAVAHGLSDAVGMHVHSELAHQAPNL
jgi:hypothetical protein